MVDESKREDAAAAMRRINRAWLDGDVERLASLVHPEMTMALPGFSGSVQGRDAVLAGFRDFVQNARIEEYRDEDLRADAAGETAVVTFRYDMIYALSGGRYHATGRDLWVFELQNNAWIAVWRAMLDMQESPA
jgi:hypothetical protein